MRHQRISLPLALITALLVILIAGLAGTALVLLRQMHGRSARTAAAETVVLQGKAMVAHLSAAPATTLLSPSEDDWIEFSHLVQNLYAFQEGLQYVSVTCNGVVVFHEQTRQLDGSPTAAAPPTPDPTGDAVEMHRKVMHIGDESLPVVVFTMSTRGAEDQDVSVSVALRKDTVNREEQATTDAIASMFRLSLLTVLVAFLICVLLVVWMMRREVKREAMRREQEHLAFSGMLANGIVHDFRNPMSSMRLDVQMLHKETQKGDATSHDRVLGLTERIRHTLDRMDKVFKEFLYVSRPDKSGPTKIDLTACIKDSLEMLAPRLEQANVTCRFEPPSGTILVRVYDASLRRALVNVLTNAEQFSPPGESIRVDLAADGQNAMVTISDNGPGIHKSKQKRVFEMFFTDRPGGTGLGLFLAKAAVERSGGTIDISHVSQQRGASIRITLPLATGTEAA
ncbi:MAG: HAMP domain-containing histidine kinase [Verrucomicrobia bacterium]|jgi:two-component system, NtrC family, sensor histidine kinase HydH|nr:HAMP domain-containing histidine kinase [Verrucomicrobiota bacterium]MBT7067939.1 HAMP domain-containing histidine kinase [Verrucomicrobiota bacterium]MBT7700592.1 HAMP domain-containing histidine kinase [Verrucomicrobiota bacterium]